MPIFASSFCLKLHCHAPHASASDTAAFLRLVTAPERERERERPLPPSKPTFQDSVDAVALLLTIIVSLYRGTNTGMVHVSYNNLTGQSLGLWLAPYTDLDLHPINDKALHYAGKPKMRVAYATLDVETYDVCFPFLVYHKATASQMGAIFKRHVDGHLPAREKPGLNENNVESIPPDLSNLTGKNSWVNALLGHH